MTSTVVCKLVFIIQAFNNKKRISIGFLIDYQIKTVILFEYELTKQTLKLYEEKLNYIMSESNFNTILSGLYTHSK
jgi:hypothetical protein